MSVSVRVCLCVLGVERLANKFIFIAKRILQAPSLSPVPPLLYVQTVRPERKKAHGPLFSYCFSLLVNSETVQRSYPPLPKKSQFPTDSSLHSMGGEDIRNPAIAEQ